MPSPGRQQALVTPGISVIRALPKNNIYIYTDTHILGWPKRSFQFFHKMVQKNSNKLFGQPKTCTYIEAERQTERQRQRETGKQMDRQTERQTGRFIYKETLRDEVTLLESEFRSLLSVSLRPRKAGDAV